MVCSLRGAPAENSVEMLIHGQKAAASISKATVRGCLGLSSVISAQFTLDMCRCLKSRKIHYKTLISGFKVIEHVGTRGKLVSRACYDKQQASKSASLRLSATVFTLDEPIAAK